MNIWENPAVIGVVIAIPSFILGYLGYRRSVEVDKFTEESGVAANDIEAVGQVIDGLNKLVANLQEDNKYLRLDVIDLRGKLVELSTRYELLRKDVNHLNGK